MKKIRVAINGFGRIGRIATRIILQNPNIELVAINDISDDHVLAHLFQYDSCHGIFNGTVEDTEHGIKFNGTEVLTYAETDPEKLPWKNLDIDVVIESSGHFTTKEKASKHLAAGAKHVILSAPPKSDDIPTYVIGVNDGGIHASQEIISNASCTTNCLAPMIKVLEDNFGMDSGVFITVHAYTNDQRIQDGPHSDLRRARASAINIIPTSTSAGGTIFKVYPHLKDKLHGSAYRVPVINGSITELVCTLKKKASVEEINNAFKKAAETNLKNVLEYTEAPIVSSDIIGNPHSSIFDAQLTAVTSDLVKVVSWYDNEFGYSNRLVELILKLYLGHENSPLEGELIA